MPVKNEKTDIGSANLVPLQLPGISNLEICQNSYEGDLGAVREYVLNSTKEGKPIETVVNTVDSSQRTALHWACSNKHTSIVKYLLDDCKADAKVQDDSCWTPLMIAASVGSAAIVDMLLAALGSDALDIINTKNQTGQTALHYAASKNHLDVTRILLQAGADVNAADSYNNTPLHRAASKGNVEMVQLLAMQGGLNTSATDSGGNTALHLACEEDRSQAATTLLRFGFSLDQKNADGKTPLDLAPDNLRRLLQQSSAA